MASKIHRLLFLAILCMGPLAAWAGKGTGTEQSTKLYTPPDPASGGGIEGRIAAPDKAIAGIFAMPQDDYKRVYRGDTDGDGRAFHFAGLPPGKYDLVVLYPDGFYEGLTLSREADSLTAGDQKAIEAAIAKSTPFFDTKKIHRCEGVTGHAEHGVREVVLEAAAVDRDLAGAGTKKGAGGSTLAATGSVVLGNGHGFLASYFWMVRIWGCWAAWS